MAGPGLLAVGTGVQALSSIASGEDKKQAYEQEAYFKQQQAVQATLASDRDAQITGTKAKLTEGAAIAGFAKGGVTLSGSPLMQLEQSSANAYGQIQAIKAAGAYKTQTLNEESGVANQLGNEAESAGYYGAFGSVLTGVAKNPYVYDQPRATPS